MKLVSMFLPTARSEIGLSANARRAAEQTVHDETMIWPWYMWTLFFWLG